MDETVTEAFEAERSRLVGLATKVLGDPVEAEDVVQQAWLRLHGTQATIDNLPGWLTTVTARLCLDRLRSRTPEPRAEVEPPGAARTRLRTWRSPTRSGWRCTWCSIG